MDFNNPGIVTKSLAAKHPKILIIDDNLNFLFGISKMLLKADFDVATASDVMIGIKKAQTELPNLILLDVSMPSMTGFEVKTKLEINPITKSIPVIFLTGLDDRLHTLSGLSVAEDYITKPFDAEILVARIKVVLRRQDK